MIGAEAYVLQNVRDLATARKFLATVAEFKERVAWHGHTAEGNPTGGNMFRGLYNIVLKSLGAAMKRHPEVRLDYVIDYGERMLQPGYYFMNSPGNDLESIAGQVAAGANMIFFITGNGSITNFPFVPTLKVVTTSQRFNMLERDMDVNAGAYQDGTPMDELGRSMFDLTVASASGARTKGEQAGHAQVSLWRDWRQTDGSHLERLQQAPLPNGAALSVAGLATAPAQTFQAVRTAAGVATDQIGLLLPTSLCSSQIARLIADRLNAAFTGNRGVSRFVALPHTEGCGVSSGHSEAMYARTTVGYLTHPLVRFGLLLEHGCEKTHNDYMANQLAQQGVDRQRFGWASVQMDGGIEQVAEKVEAWFGEALGGLSDPEWADAGLGALRLWAVGQRPRARYRGRAIGSSDRRRRQRRWHGGPAEQRRSAVVVCLPRQPQDELADRGVAGLRSDRHAGAARHGNADAPLGGNADRPRRHRRGDHAGARRRPAPAGASHDSAAAGCQRRGNGVVGGYGPDARQRRAVDRDHSAPGAVGRFSRLRAEAVRAGQHRFSGVAGSAGHFDVRRGGRSATRPGTGRRTAPASPAPGAGRMPG